jgi:hypothetical protein
MNHQQKLERFAHSHTRAALKKSIIPLDNNGYLVFGQYVITSSHNRFDVFQYNDPVGSFGSKKTAMSWCIAESCKQYQLSFDIQVLDLKKSQLSADISTRRRIGEMSKHSSTAELIETKLEPKIRYYNSVKAELEKCINSAKYLQLRGFSNETARSSRG